MSARPKAFLKQAKFKGKKEQKLETADDFQAAGVDYEDAAGKWRAGDAQKSMRFFQRAIEVYDQGLQLFPQSLDLAYNKARVQLELATHPVLIKQLTCPTIDQLEIALQSHYVALALDEDNADTLFNTAQVLTSIAEESARDDSRPESDALQALQKALELQSRCLQMQEKRYEESQRQQQQQKQTQGGLSNANVSSKSDDDEDGGTAVDVAGQEAQWFSIIEPVTIDVLIDTALAQLNTLTTLCNILTNLTEQIPNTTLSWIEDYASQTLTVILPRYFSITSERVHEVALAKARFQSILLEVGFQTQTLDAETYKRERDSIFADPGLQLDTNIDALIANARSLLSYNYAMGPVLIDPDTSPIMPSVRWTILAAVIANATTASKIPGISADDLSATHSLRGESSLLQYLMGFSPCTYQLAITNASQLLKNAEVFYRNASKLATESEEKDTAAFKSAVAAYLDRKDNQLATIVAQKGNTWSQSQLDDIELPPSFDLILDTMRS